MSNDHYSSVEIPVIAVSRRRPASSDNRALSSDNRGTGNSFFPRSWQYQQEIMMDPWSLFEERVRTGPFGLTGFPSPPHSPVYILTIGDPTAEDLNPRLLNFVRVSQPRALAEHWNLTLPTERPVATLTEGEFNNVMKKMKKKVYKPKSTGMFFKSSNKRKKDDNVEDEECTICLEKFVAGQDMLITPCNHMFHGDCLLPWVRSHGKCPVCRLAFSERSEELSVANAHMGDADSDSILPLIRAMEEAFSWINRRY
ncbi:E3 ubiquitin-protein ligase [Nymphaea thermarum]|nr:E3 ubiquitin-protein ligase [Nymphaea thermarum]